MAKAESFRALGLPPPFPDRLVRLMGRIQHTMQRIIAALRCILQIQTPRYSDDSE